MAVFDNIAFDDHERVVFCRDKVTGLNDTARLGGLTAASRDFH